MIGERQKKILKSIVEEYVKTARAVGSKSLCQKFKCSSATIRNDMSELEELGYLEKQHISSGRIPSEKGYRYYVDYLMEPKKISGEDMLKLQTIFSNNELNLNSAILKSLEIISDITNYTSVVLGKTSEENKLEKVELIPLSYNELVAILITDKGKVENKKVFLKEQIDISEVIKTSELLNKMLSGTPINEVGAKLEYEIKPIIGNYVKNYEVIYNAFCEAFSNFANNSEVRWRGKSNILKLPDFNTVDEVKNIVSKLESKDVVSKIEESKEEVQVYIGSESELDENVTVVKTKVSTGSDEISLAIIGPKRMEYGKVVSMLEFIKDSIEKKGIDYGKGKETERRKETESK